MKLRYAIIFCIILRVIEIICDELFILFPTSLINRLFMLAVTLTIAYAIYIFIRYIFRAIKGIVTKPREGR